MLLFAWLWTAVACAEERQWLELFACERSCLGFGATTAQCARTTSKLIDRWRTTGRAPEAQLLRLVRECPGEIGDNAIYVLGIVGGSGALQGLRWIAEETSKNGVWAGRRWRRGSRLKAVYWALALLSRKYPAKAADALFETAQGARHLDPCGTVELEYAFQMVKTGDPAAVAIEMIKHPRAVTEKLETLSRGCSHSSSEFSAYQ